MKLSLTYTKLPESLYSKLEPPVCLHPKLVLYNKNLGHSLGINSADIFSENFVDTLLGRNLPKGQSPIAQAYAGHQYGHFTVLGDGRAMLLGEIVNSAGKRFDLHLKGSGCTPYSRHADGKATLGPMLREYLFSEAMFALRIPTTRGLAVIDTGEMVDRQQPEQGAVLVRVAESHIRVGTFEYARLKDETAILPALLEYTIQRHYPELKTAENPALALLVSVINRQAALMAEWMRVGFIHGIMNTDNITVSGETLDYGPCAFMNRYDVNTVFSSIDKNGRYAYGNQPAVAKWNLACFAQALLPLLSNDQDKAVAMAEQTINQFDTAYQQKWQQMMANKLGLVQVESCDEYLFSSLLLIMQKYGLDYTNTFYALTYDMDLLANKKNPEMDAWVKQWLQRIKESQRSIETAQKHMQYYNPVVIPRNYLVESALQAAVSEDDLEPINSLLAVLLKPYELSNYIERYQKVPPHFDDSYQTFCGT